MPEETIDVLLIEDDLDDQFLVKETLLSDSSGTRLTVESADRLETGLERMSARPPSAVLLDLSLSDSRGIDTFLRVHTFSPTVPIIILSGNQDEDMALEAVRLGAQDYLLKGDMDNKTLPRVIRYAIERNRNQQELQSLSILDDLTRLYNRRGFLMLAGQYLKLAK